MEFKKIFEMYEHPEQKTRWLYAQGSFPPYADFAAAGLNPSCPHDDNIMQDKIDSFYDRDVVWICEGSDGNFYQVMFDCGDKPIVWQDVEYCAEED